MTKRKVDRKKEEPVAQAAEAVMNERPCDGCMDKASERCRDCGPEHVNYEAKPGQGVVKTKTVQVDLTNKPIAKKEKFVKKTTVKRTYVTERGLFKLGISESQMYDLHPVDSVELCTMVRTKLRIVPKRAEEVEDGDFDEGVAEIYIILREAIPEVYREENARRLRAGGFP